MLYTTPPGTHFTAPFHVILNSMARYKSTSMSKVLRSIMIVMNRKHPADTSWSCLMPHLIRRHKSRHWHRQFCTIQQFRLDSTQGFWRDLAQVFLTGFNSRFLTVFDSGFSDSVWPKVFDWIWLTVFDGIWIRVFYSIWFTFNIIIFNLSLIIQVPFQTGLRESHIYQGVSKITQNRNSGIFHNSGNLNWFCWEHS